MRSVELPVLLREVRAGLINPPLDDVALAEFGRALVEGW
jgi:hypothetical protein